MNEQRDLATRVAGLFIQLIATRDQLETLLSAKNVCMPLYSLSLVRLQGGEGVF